MIPADVRPRRKTRLGWLGPVVLALGVAVGIAGMYVMATSRPAPGAVIEVIAIDAEFAILVRREDDPGGWRNFIQLVHARRGVEWSAMVPRYAGSPSRPAIAWAANAISVRVIRDGRPELWSLSTIDASKLGQISLAAYAMGTPVAGKSEVITATDGTRGFEVVDGSEGTRLVAFDLSRGAHLWTRDFDRLPIHAIEVHGAALKVMTSDGDTYWTDVATGERATDVTPASYPRGALAPNAVPEAVWELRGDTLEVRDTQTGRIVAKLAIP